MSAGGEDRGDGDRPLRGQHVDHLRARVDEDLRGDRRRVETVETSVAGHEAHDGREVAARAVAHDRDARGVEAPGAGVGDERGDGVVAVLRGHRERVLGRQAVVDGHHDDRALAGDVRAEPLGLVEVALHEAAAVEVDARRARGSRCSRAGRRAPGDPRARPRWAGGRRRSVTSRGAGPMTARPSGPCCRRSTASRAAGTSAGSRWATEPPSRRRRAPRRRRPRGRRTPGASSTGRAPVTSGRGRHTWR